MPENNAVLGRKFDRDIWGNADVLHDEPNIAIMVRCITRSAARNKAEHAVYTPHLFSSHSAICKCQADLHHLGAAAPTNNRQRTHSTHTCAGGRPC